MTFYGDVSPGEAFTPSAALSNDVRHLLNSLDGFRAAPFGATGGGTVRIQIYNASDAPMAAGEAVNFDNSKGMADGTVPAIRLIDPRRPWGVVTQALGMNEAGDCIISGPVAVRTTGSGVRAMPTVASPAIFTLGNAGAQVLHSYNGKALVNLGAGSAEEYDGPFAVSYDAETGLLNINAGFMSRNGEFLEVAGAEIAPETGFVCVRSVLEDAGEWTEPEILVGLPDKYTYPVGSCAVEGEDDARSISVCSFRVPVAIIIDTAVCPLSTEYRE